MEKKFKKAEAFFDVWFFSFQYGVFMLEFIQLAFQKNFDVIRYAGVFAVIVIFLAAISNTFITIIADYIEFRFRKIINGFRELNK